MDSDTIISIVWGAVLVGIPLAIYFAYRRRRGTKRLLIMELLEGYFQGDMPADELAKRTREIAGQHFMPQRGIVLAGYYGLSMRHGCNTYTTGSFLGKRDEIGATVGGFEEGVRTDNLRSFGAGFPCVGAATDYGKW